MEQLILATGVVLVSLAFLAVIALLGVVALVRDQGHVAKLAMDILREWSKSLRLSLASLEDHIGQSQQSVAGEVKGGGAPTQPFRRD